MKTQCEQNSQLGAILNFKRDGYISGKATLLKLYTFVSVPKGVFNQYTTVNPLYTHTRYNDNIRYNDNLNVTKHSLKR